MTGKLSVNKYAAKLLMFFIQGEKTTFTKYVFPPARLIGRI
jgi:hypothetical protein